MMFQNESIDEDLEHFEDIVEEAENPASPTSEKPDNAGEVAHSSDGNNIDSESSLDERGSPTLDSEDDILDKEDDLLVGGNLNNVQEESRRMSDHNGHQPQVFNLTSSLPGGYNLRHREPSYWYSILVLIFNFELQLVSLYVATISND